MQVFILFVALMINNITVAYAEQIKFNNIAISKAWIKDTPPNHKTTAGYFTIENLSDTDRILLSVSSSFAAKGEIHQILKDGDIMKMRPVSNGLVIPAGKILYLKPGSFHVMFMKLNTQMIPMQEHEITLTFQSLGSVVVPATVKSTPTKDKPRSERHNH